MTSGVSSLRLVRTNRPFRLLWTARTVSFLGDGQSSAFPINPANPSASPLRVYP